MIIVIKLLIILLMKKYIYCDNLQSINFQIIFAKIALSIVQWWKAKVGQGFVLMILLQTRKIGIWWLVRLILTQTFNCTNS